MRQFVVFLLIFVISGCGDTLSSSSTTNQVQDQQQEDQIEGAISEGGNSEDDICDCVQTVVNDSPDNRLESDCPGSFSSTITDSVFLEAVDSCNAARSSAGCGDDCEARF